MRILHTSDWHVGRTFHGRDLLADQEAVLGAIADLCVEHAVDVVVVAGDLYDRAVPGADAVEVCGRAFTRIREAGATLVVTPGNHDSAPRLGVHAAFAAAGGLHLRARTADVGEAVVLTDEHGPVAFYGLPYLEPETARHALGVPDARGHAGVLGEAMRRVRADLAGRPAGTRSVAIAHAFVVGGKASESERNISVGGVETVSARVFDGVDYAALGHLHGPQIVAEHLRYSGSPLAYSFGEKSHRKSVWLVDLDAAGLREVTRVDLPVPRPLAVVAGELAEVLADPAHDAVAGHYLSVVLTDAVRPIDPMRRLQERFPHAVHLEWRPAGVERVDTPYAERVRGRSDLEVAASFVADVRGAGPTAGESDLLERAFAAVRTVEAER
jgi:exonuclease SbcD